ncbi:LppM family (lipo)protein [Jiangella endophytica]|uniref:LppM family (lipo)protein n=1 Tax=Jiangella endophytica TaxID=1623398 RepID=UPI0013005D61|nr:DUF3153 domain-containing protein [Jiangella endophytica]
MNRTRPVRALTVVAAALLLTGCVKMDMQLDVGEDDTVNGEIILAISRDASAVADAMGEDPSDLFGELGQDLPDGAEAEAYEDGDYVGQRLVFEDSALSEFADAGASGFSITHEGDEIVVAGSLDMSDLDPESMGGDLEQLQDELGAGAGDLGDLEGLMDSFDLNISITFPGEVTEHNGDLDGTTVSWTPVPGEANELSARSADSGGGGGDGIPVWIWILIVVVVAGLVGLLFFLSRNRDQAPPAEEATVGAVPPPPGPGPDAEAAPEAAASPPAGPFAPPSGAEAPVQPTTPLPVQPEPSAEGDQPEPPAAPR